MRSGPPVQPPAPAARPLAVLATLAFALAACGGAGPVRPPSADARASLRAVFFGSSTVAGTGASRPERSFAAQLAREEGWREVNLGLPGSRLTALPARIASGEDRWREVVAARPDVVVVMYGANDVDWDVPLGDAQAPRTFRHAAHGVLLALHQALPQALLVVLSPQPARALSGRRVPYDAALAEAAAEVGAVYVPGADAFPEGELATLARDRLHLNDAGHAAFARFVAARLKVARKGGVVAAGSGR